MPSPRTRHVRRPRYRGPVDMDKNSRFVGLTGQTRMERFLRREEPITPPAARAQEAQIKKQHQTPQVAGFGWG